MALSYERQRIAVIGLLLLWCLALIVYRIKISPDGLSGGLIWNLFLATIPLFCSAAFELASERRYKALAVISFGFWLLFLPNAPYILTDLIHLKPKPNTPPWYLLATLLSCAGTGTLLGYLSLINVHNVIERKFGVIAGWIVAVGSLMLCGFGIYLGRFLRWNSWDAFTQPFSLLRTIIRQLIDPGPHPSPFAVTFIFGVGLIVGYLALRVVSSGPRPN